jgi:hypothetical protein
MQTQAPRRKSPTPEEIVARQKRDAKTLRAQEQPTMKSPYAPPAMPKLPAAAPSQTAVAVPDSRDSVERYVDTVAPTVIAGELIKFSKEGKFVINETGEELSPDADFIALCDEMLVGYIRFHGDDAPPDRAQGLLYNGFVLPPRASLGDMDESLWEPGLSGEPADPWQHQMNLVLQNPTTQALYTFATSSVTGRRSVGNLLHHYNRLRKKDADLYPVVRLRPSGFQHKDPRVGWVNTPSFVVVGSMSKNSAAVPDTSVAADMNDEIKF